MVCSYRSSLLHTVLENIPFTTTRDYVSVDVFKKFYQGYILPQIDYGSVIWSRTSPANTERIFKLQKRAARIILHADYDTPSTPSAIIFRGLEWQPVNKRLAYNKSK